MGNSIYNRYGLPQELIVHSEETSRYSQILAELLCLDREFIERIKKGALLHDIGKIKISKKLLDKTSKLEKKEFEEMKKHIKYGSEMLLEEDRDEIVENILLFHHENWDGKGYPFEIRESRIPVEARIVAIADSYAALRAKRSYKEELSHEEALKKLIENKGKRFDPNILSIFEEFEELFSK